MTEPRFGATDTKPWYRYPWPWFLIGILAYGVATGVTTLVIAFWDPDPLVKDDWYKEGQAINRTLARDQRARDLGLSVALKVDALTGEVSVALRGPAQARPSSLALELQHPTRKELDQTLALSWVEHQGVFRGQLTHAAKGAWYATVSPGESSDPEAARAGERWRLVRKIFLPTQTAIELNPME